jgi:antitoxin ParD1/3/4
MLEKSSSLANVLIAIMNITLTKEQEKFINRQVKSGRYLDASDVMRDALRALETQTEEDPALETALLEAVASERRPLNDATYERIRKRARQAK